MEKLKLTILIENTAREDSLKAENGLSLLLQRGEDTLLFDCGDTGAFIDNAKALGLDLSRVSAVALSHNHYDHTRGYLRFIEEFGAKQPLYLSRLFFKSCYWDDENEPGLIKPTMGPLTPHCLMQKFVNYRLVSNSVLEIPEFPGAYLVSGFERIVPMERADDTNLTGDCADGGTDLYLDEQAMVVKTGKGLLLLTGCAHVGVLNIIENVKRRFSEPIVAVVGGTHLVAADEERTAATIDALAKSGIPFVGVCHCTGPMAFEACEAKGFPRLRGGDSFEF